LLRLVGVLLYCVDVAPICCLNLVLGLLAKGPQHSILIVLYSTTSENPGVKFQVDYFNV